MNEYYQVLYTESAIQDLEEKADYISLNLHEPSLAEAWYLRLRAEIQANLIQFPCKYPLYRIEKWASKGIRQFTFHNDVILYSVDTSKRLVYIRAVCTKGQDLSFHLEHL